MSGSQLVADPYLLLVRLINTGRHAVSKEDFQREPCKIVLDRVVLSVEVADKSDSQMEAFAEWKGSEAQLQPMLFKPGEWIALAILTDGKPDDQSVDLRSPRIAKPREYKPREYRDVAESLSFFAGACLWIGIILLLSSLNKFVVRRDLLTQDNADSMSGIIALAAIGLCVFVGRRISRLLKKWFGRRAEAMKVL
jgi:hypothetical protein